MSNLNGLYPATPTNVSLSVTNPGTAYKKEVKKVMLTILLFFIVYVVLIILAVLLSIACVYLGISVMAGTGSLIGILAGLGIISIGFMTCIFLIKFIFSVKKYDESKTVTITEEEQPQLFDFIRRLTKDTQTNFPKKIVLSTDVNASVYYNDSFWSMLFPVKKNLQIGLGLVNTLSLGEFKAVMAHEFGHFSQKSMKLGSFVYNVNKAIYNMLYENKDFGKFLSGWGSVHFAVGIFVWVTVQIITGIQKILGLMYSIINKQYMGLSREMEFHADAVAASVSGSNNCISALKKLDISDNCFNTVLQKADEYLDQKKVLKNIYTKHNIVMRQFAETYHLPTENNVPIATDEFLRGSQLSKINIKNQWASHPSMEDRETKLSELSVEAETDNRSAWILFANAAEIQEKLTTVVYQHLPEEIKKETVAEHAFEENYTAEIKNYSLPEAYKGYYGNRSLPVTNIEEMCKRKYTSSIDEDNFNVLFADDKITLPKELAALEADARIVEAIAGGGTDIASFDYDGVKYKKNEATTVLDSINAEIIQVVEKLQKQDDEIISFFYTAAQMNGEDAAAKFKQHYMMYEEMSKQVTAFTGIYQQVYTQLSPLLQGQQVGIEAAESMARELKDLSEQLKTFLRFFIKYDMIQHEETLETIKQFINADYSYFWDKSFFETDLSSLKKTIDGCMNETSVAQFKLYKQILETQLAYYKTLQKENTTINTAVV